MTSRMGRYDSLKDSGVLDNTMKPKQDRDRRTINDYIADLNSGQERLQNTINVLEERLGTALKPELPEGKALEDEAPSEMSPMAHWLHKMLGQQERLYIRLADLVERVDL